MTDDADQVPISESGFREPDGEQSGSPLDQVAKDEVGQFIANASQLLEPGFVEPISEETRKSQRALLLISLAVILLASGAIGVSGTVKTDGFEFSVERQTLLVVGMVACSYLEVLVMVRCFAEWKLYKLKTSLSERELWAVFRELRKAKSEYLLPFSHTSYEMPRKAGNSEAATNNNENAKNRYTDEARLISEKMRWFIGQFSAVGNARKGKLFIDVLFPLIAGSVAIIFATRNIYLMHLIKSAAH